MDGILNIDKPPGRTSFSVVARVRRLSGEKRVGHAGTLDPDATGVLPICLGRGTRIVEFLVNTTKTYHAEIELGLTTDTYDSSGHVTQQRDPTGIDRKQLESALEQFRGPIRQTPPMYSAIKHKGRPLYELARAGIQIERRSRPVTVHQLELIAWKAPTATVEVECSKGTYIRSLAHDLGQYLDCGAHLKSLIRTRCGIFDIKDAISMPRLEEAFSQGYWEHYVYPVDTVLQNYRAIVVDETTEEAIRQGNHIALEDNIGSSSDGESVPEHCRAYSIDGRFLGILSSIPEKGAWKPKKVLF